MQVINKDDDVDEVMTMLTTTTEKNDEDEAAVLELGTFGKEEMEELMLELKDVISDEDKSSEDANFDVALRPPTRIVVVDGEDDAALAVLDSDYSSSSVATTTANSSEDDGGEPVVEGEEGEVAETTVAAEEDTTTTTTYELFGSLCAACEEADKAHTALLEAEDALRFAQGESCFAPSTHREFEDVEVVRTVAGHLPSLFTELEANGYLPCDVGQRYAVVGLARTLLGACEALADACADEEEEE